MRLLIIIAGFVYYASHTKPNPTELSLFVVLVVTCIQYYNLRSAKEAKKPQNSRRVRF